MPLATLFTENREYHSTIAVEVINYLLHKIHSHVIGLMDPESSLNINQPPQSLL